MRKKLQQQECKKNPQQNCSREVRSHAFPPILQLASLSLAHTAITTLAQVVIIVMMRSQ